MTKNKHKELKEIYTIWCDHLGGATKALQSHATITENMNVCIMSIKSFFTITSMSLFF